MFSENYVQMHLAQRRCVHALLKDIEIQITAYTALMNRVRNSKVDKAGSKYRYTIIPKLTVRSEKFDPGRLPESGEIDAAPRIRWYQYESVRRAGTNKIVREVKTNKTGYTINTFKKYVPIEIAKVAYQTEKMLSEYRCLLSDLYLFKRAKKRAMNMDDLSDSIEEAYAEVKK